jgi:hypothetical protein
MALVLQQNIGDNQDSGPKLVRIPDNQEPLVPRKQTNLAFTWLGAFIHDK